MLSTIDLLVVGLYLAGIVVFGLLRRRESVSTTVEYLIGGRKLTLPALVATLVSNWYGGILGVGEYSYRFGISNWFVFGVPYYIAALLFAWLLASKARRTEFITIPDRLNQVYGRHAAGLGAIVVFLWTLPVAYVLILGVLGSTFFGWPQWAGIVVGTLLVGAYAFLGGFKSLVRADLWHFTFMYLGFVIITAALLIGYGGLDFLKAHVPAENFTWSGGNSFWYIAVWYVIALATLVEPSFFQVAYAAKSERVAKQGILVSIACWFLFDLMTTTCGLYARAILPADINPIAAYPLLGDAVLPVGLSGLFAVAMLATVISTADSYLFIAASTLGKDIIADWGKRGEARANYFTKWALVLGGILTAIITMYFESVVSVWYYFGSIGTPILLVPLVSTYLGKRRLSEAGAIASMLLSGGVSLVWALSANWTAAGGYWWGLEPILPGLFVSIVVYLSTSRREGERISTGQAAGG